MNPPLTAELWEYRCLIGELLTTLTAMLHSVISHFTFLHTNIYVKLKGNTVLSYSLQYRYCCMLFYPPYHQTRLLILGDLHKSQMF